MLLSVQDVNQEVLSVVELQTAELEIYKMLLAEYCKQLANAKQVLDTIQTVCTQIVTTISASNIVYIKNTISVYQMLKVLKKRLVSTDKARILEVEQRYQRLRRFNKQEKVER
jgi:hypothetical protein